MAFLAVDTRLTEDRPARERSRVGPIDGLRGLALVAVLLYHVAPGTVRGGFLGVESFFVLSGYLLTALLLDEHRRTGRIDRAGYAQRRLRRIYPGLIVLLAVLVVVVPLITGDRCHSFLLADRGGAAFDLDDSDKVLLATLGTIISALLATTLWRNMPTREAARWAYRVAETLAVRMAFTTALFLVTESYWVRKSRSRSMAVWENSPS